MAKLIGGAKELFFAFAGKHKDRAAGGNLRQSKSGD
jgi:hypothetical protein